MPQSNSDTAAPASRLTYLPIALEHPGGDDAGSRRWAQAALSAIGAAGSIDASLLENTFAS